MTLGNPLLLYPWFGFVGSSRAVLPATSWDVEVLTTGSIGDCLPNPLLLERSFGYSGSVGAVLLTTERDAELVLTTCSMMGCLPITDVGLEIGMCCELVSAAVLTTKLDAELCLANGFWMDS